MAVKIELKQYIDLNLMLASKNTSAPVLKYLSHISFESNMYLASERA
jgi:hypothetical protein